MKPHSSSPSFNLKQNRKFVIRAILLFCALSVLLLIAMNPWGKTSTNPILQAATVSPTGQTLATMTPTPLTGRDSFEQTNGIILGSILLVLIIVGGTLGVLRRTAQQQER